MSGSPHTRANASANSTTHLAAQLAGSTPELSTRLPPCDRHIADNRARDETNHVGSIGNVADPARHADEQPCRHHPHDLFIHAQPEVRLESLLDPDVAE